MSHVENITYEELLRECQIEDPNEFQRILRRRKDLPQVSHRKMVPYKVANTIVKALTTHGIDWKKYETKARDTEDNGPLVWSSSSEVLNRVNSWYLEIEKTDTTWHESFRFVALVSSGGFLSGHDQPDFVLSFDKGINVIIGDRGSGKSTALSLLGAVSESVGEETQVLVQRLLSILHVGENNNENETANLNRHILGVLRRYNMDEYGIFFIEHGHLYCYYVGRRNHCYSYLNYNDSWQFVQSQKSSPQIPLLFLSQGEVTRIAEDRDKKSYLNNIMDAIYPDLYSKRVKLINSVKSILLQKSNYQPAYTYSKNPYTNQFLTERDNELKKMRWDVSNNRFGLDNERIIYDYLNRSKEYRSTQPDKFWETKGIMDYFQETDEDVLYYLYVSGIRNFLYDKLSKIRELRWNEKTPYKASPDFVKDPVDNVKRNVEPELSPENNSSFENSETATNDEISFPIIDIADEDLEKIDVKDDIGFNNSEEKILGLDVAQIAAENMHPSRVSRELLSVASEILQFLQNRLRVMLNWHKIYSFQRVEYNEVLNSLARKYVTLLELKELLIREQSSKCTIMTEMFKKEPTIRITTMQVEQSIDEMADLTKKINRLELDYHKIVQATPSTHLRELRAIQFEYDDTVRFLLEGLNRLDEQLGQEIIDIEFFTFPIKIELLQGNMYREFQQLSFGQKSGIILKMVLSTTNKSIILIDQPEDNLDVYSIIKIIAPLLSNLRTEHARQIIVVTHNSNLVMESSPNRLIALEPRGDSGVIKYQGSHLVKEAVEDIFNILEGGVATFSQKITTYEKFVGLVKKVEDWEDIHIIESSFRQRTIDGLRNYLQPIVSDKSMMDFLRHQLKQWNPMEYQQHIRKFIDDLEQMEENPEKGHEDLFSMLTGLAEELDVHIERFMGSIEDIKLLDTLPKKEIIDIYSLLMKRKQDRHIEDLRRSRRIVIEIAPEVQGINVFADLNHLKLVFQNLIENSLTATEKVAILLRKNPDAHYTETISIGLEEQDDQCVKISYSDNGCGVPDKILNQLYKEPCSSKVGKDHGLGGIIIKKLLQLNNGSIVIKNSRSSPLNSGLTQSILLSKVPSEESAE